MTDAEQLIIYRDIFAEITAKAMPICDDDRVRHYVVPVGPIHRAAGKLGFQMFDGEQHLKNAIDKISQLKAALEKIRGVGREDWEFRDGEVVPTWRLIAREALDN